MADLFELGCQGVDHLVDRYWDRGWDKATLRRRKSRKAQVDIYSSDRQPQRQQQQQQQEQQQQSQSQSYSQSQYKSQSQSQRYQQSSQQSPDYNRSSSSPAPPQRLSTRRSVPGATAAETATATPALDGNIDSNRTAFNSIAATSRPSTRTSRSQRRNDSLERQSEASERILLAYESERDDPRRKPETVLSKLELRAMSHTNVYAPYDNVGNGGGGGGGGGSYHSRGRSADARYYNDDGYGSDYDEHTGQRYSRGQGRGYDDYDDRIYDREIVQTERYHGPARNFPGRQDSGGNRGSDDRYGPSGGAVTQYRRSDRDRDRDDGGYDGKRSRSRGRRDRDRDQDRDYSRSRSRSRSRSGGVLSRLDEHFDKSPGGLGAGLVGAVVGGLAGREISGRSGHGSQHRNRDILIGAVVGGLGANLAENKWRDWKEGEKRRLEGDEDRWEQRWDGRSRSAMR